MPKRINSRRKGARIERQAAEFLRSIGIHAERNARNGLSEPDLVIPGLDLHIEVKGDRDIGLGTKALEMAMDQALADSKKADYAVLWMEYRKGWRLTYWAEGYTLTLGYVDDIRDYLHRFYRKPEQS